MSDKVAKRRGAVDDLKRQLIIEAARQVFERDGLDGASLRSIAREAGYTPAALYFHFDSKEALYGAVLSQSLERLNAAIAAADMHDSPPAARLKSVAGAFFTFYAENPRDLDLGFYLFRGGMTPRGLGRDLDQALNAALSRALAPIGEAAMALGASTSEARDMTVDIFAHASGLLLLSHTGRIRMFGTDASARMTCYVEERIALLTGGNAHAAP